MEGQFQVQLIPPFRYAIVEENLYRGAYPTIKNFRFLKRLRLRSILSITPEPPNRDLRNFCEDQGIRLEHYRVDKFQDVVTLSHQQVIDILCSLVSADNLPAYLHCLDGSHVTGLLVMCLRKLQCWNLATSTAEFCRFQRTGEISREESQFVEAFKGSIPLPPRIPSWLWMVRSDSTSPLLPLSFVLQGDRHVVHPTFHLVLEEESKTV